MQSAKLFATIASLADDVNALKLCKSQIKTSASSVSDAVLQAAKSEYTKSCVDQGIAMKRAEAMAHDMQTLVANNAAQTTAYVDQHVAQIKKSHAEEQKSSIVEFQTTLAKLAAELKKSYAEERAFAAGLSLKIDEMAKTAASLTKAMAETKADLAKSVAETQTIKADMKKLGLTKETVDHIQQLEVQLQTKLTAKKPKKTAVVEPVVVLPATPAPTAAKK